MRTFLIMLLLCSTGLVSAQVVTTRTAGKSLQIMEQAFSMLWPMNSSWHWMPFRRPSKLRLTLLTPTFAGDVNMQMGHYVEAKQYYEEAIGLQDDYGCIHV